MKIKKLLGFIFFFVVTEFIAALGGFITSPAIKTWYKTLNKSSLNPPNSVFPIVWAILYVLMAISAFLVWNKAMSAKKALGLYFIQLGLNLLWSILFFGFKNPLAALVEIVALWLAILLTIIKFYKISKPAGLILIPYLMWVSFASVLNYTIVILNK